MLISHRLRHIYVMKMLQLNIHHVANWFVPVCGCPLLE